MKILVVGGGGREHAVIRKLMESPRAEKIYCAPGNGGIGCDAENVPIAATDVEGMVDFAVKNHIDLVCVTPDDPLAAGMVDALQKAGVRAFGPNKAAAQIEASKVFSKRLMKTYNIPTAAYEVFSDADEAIAFIRRRGEYPVVVKADGLALGKGVLIAQNEEEAVAAVKTIMEDHAFGARPGNQIVRRGIFDRPRGQRPRVYGRQDLKADGQQQRPQACLRRATRARIRAAWAPISPNPDYTDEMAARCMQEIFLPTVHAMNAEGRPFCGCLYFGLMLTPNGPKVIEYNSRFGDPEAQVVLPRLETDLVDIMEATIDGTLADLDIRWKPGACACVVMASGGYPESYQKGFEIHGLDANGQLDGMDGVTVYHAGTKRENGKFYTNGGRVLGVTCTGQTLDEALDKAYEAVGRITWEGVHYRRDIGRA